MCVMVPPDKPEPPTPQPKVRLHHMLAHLADALGGTQADDDVVHAYVQSRKKRKAQI